jgi:hypothetical protein
LGRYRPSAGVFPVGLAGVERLDLLEPVNALGAHERRLEPHTPSHAEEQALVATRRLAEHTDGGIAVLCGEGLHSAEDALDGVGAVGDAVLEGDLAPFCYAAGRAVALELAEEVERILGDVGREEQRRARVVNGSGGTDLHGGPLAAGWKCLDNLKICRPRSAASR